MGGLATASEILGGKDLTLAIARGKVAAWKVEGDEVENLLVRCEARGCGQVPIGEHQRNLRRRRERATSKLFVWFDRVMQASCPFHEAKKMEEAMVAVLDRIRENYTDVSRTKLELQEILYDLRNALDKLLQARSETLIPRLKYVRRRIARKQILSTVGRQPAWRLFLLRFLCQSS